MTVWVIRNGSAVIKGSDRGMEKTRSDFPTPRISRMASYESPITGKEVTSWSQRDREMREHDCFDPRDLPKDHVYEKSAGRKKKG
jgi:hypothetical protein